MTQDATMHPATEEAGCAEMSADGIVPHMKILVIEDDLEAAISDGVATAQIQDVEQAVAAAVWNPEYVTMK